MYDIRGTGRIGFEIQYDLVVDQDAVVFSNSDKKLAQEFDWDHLDLDCTMADGWRWVGDPVKGPRYLPDDKPVPDELKRFFITKHRTEYRDSIGANTLWTWHYEKRVVLQLELITDPHDPWDWPSYSHDLRYAYAESMSELLRKDIVGVYPGRDRRNIQMKPQVNIELHRDIWDDGLSAWTRLSWIAAGMYLLLRLRDAYTVNDDLGRLIGHLQYTFDRAARMSWRTDLISNTGLLLDAHFFGRHLSPRLDADWVRKLLTEPGGIALLTTAYDNDGCVFHVKGLPKLTASELGRFGIDDLTRLRTLGIDVHILDVLGDRTQSHNHPALLEMLRLEFLRNSIAAFTDLDPLARFVRGTLGDEDVETPDAVDWPLFNPRKTYSPGCVYVELRTLGDIPWQGSKRYHRTFWPVTRNNAGDKLNVDYLGHLRPLALDTTDVLDIAILAGRAFLADLERGLPAFEDADFQALKTTYGPMIDALFRNYRHPAR